MNDPLGFDRNKVDPGLSVKRSELVWVGMNEAGTEPMKEQALAGG
jgi:hypothetical protein